MATVTVRNLDESTKQALRLRAARNGVSMEEEVRRVLRQSVGEAHEKRPRRESFMDSIRRLKEKYGSYDLELPARDDMREPPTFD